MRNQAPISDTVTVHVPFRIVKRGGRKEMVLPVNALAGAFHWKRMLEAGEFTTMAELAEREEALHRHT